MNRKELEVSNVEISPHSAQPISEGTATPSVQSVDLRIWASTGLDIALSCLERVQPTLIRTAELFREDQKRANAFLFHCIEGLERFMEAMAITKTAIPLDLQKVPTDIGTLAGTEKELVQILKDMLALQEANQYDELADKVEYELITNLHVWMKTLKRLNRHE
jgi:hypothetical protein